MMMMIGMIGKQLESVKVVMSKENLLILFKRANQLNKGLGNLRKEKGDVFASFDRVRLSLFAFRPCGVLATHSHTGHACYGCAFFWT